MIAVRLNVSILFKIDVYSVIGERVYVRGALLGVVGCILELVLAFKCHALTYITLFYNM